MKLSSTNLLKRRKMKRRRSELSFKTSSTNSRIFSRRRSKKWELQARLEKRSSLARSHLSRNRLTIRISTSTHWLKLSLTLRRTLKSARASSSRGTSKFRNLKRRFADSNMTLTKQRRVVTKPPKPSISNSRESKRNTSSTASNQSVTSTAWRTSLPKSTSVKWISWGKSTSKCSMKCKWMLQMTKSSSKMNFVRR